jgi:hypothetical protein
VDAHPTVPQYRRLLGLSLNHLGNIAMLQAEKGQTERDRKACRQQAETSYLQSLRCHERLANDYPAQHVHLLDVGRASGNLGNARRDMQQIPEAVEAYDRARGALSQVLKQQPDHSEAQEAWRNNESWRAGVLGRAANRER